MTETRDSTTLSEPLLGSTAHGRYGRAFDEASRADGEWSMD
jgi:hypothetical protein